MLAQELRLLFNAALSTSEIGEPCRFTRSGTGCAEPLPGMPFGAIANPIRMMETEHDSAGRILRDIHRIAGDFELPAYACFTYKAPMSGLAELERDLHLHIHLENNVLFPPRGGTRSPERGMAYIIAEPCKG